MENALVDLLPRSMIPVVLRRLDISRNAGQFLTKQKRRALVELLKAFPIDITGKRPVSEAIITSGGVKVSEIDPKTMESKLVAGLYFARGRSLTATLTPAASTCRSHGRRPMPQGWRLGKNRALTNAGSCNRIR